MAFSTFAGTRVLGGPFKTRQIFRGGGVCLYTMAGTLRDENERPSRADEELTAKIKEAARFLDIRVIDHVIVSEEGYFSFADEGIL